MKLTRVNYFRSEVINFKTVSQINAKFCLFTTWSTVNNDLHYNICKQSKSKTSFFEMMKGEVLTFLSMLLPMAFPNNTTDQTVKPLMMKFGHKTQILQCYQFPNGGGFSVRYSIIRMSGRKLSCLIFRHFVHTPINTNDKNIFFFRLTHYTADFRQYNLDNKASSCCFSGIWILYDDYNYKFNNTTVRCDM
jgi:hypothetical protein